MKKNLSVLILIGVVRGIKSRPRQRQSGGKALSESPEKSIAVRRPAGYIIPDGYFIRAHEMKGTDQMVRSGWFIALICSIAGGFASFCQAGSEQADVQAPRRYGSVRVEKIHGLGDKGRIICDVAGWPAIAGSEIPVQIRGIEIGGGQRLSTSVRSFILEKLRAGLKEPTNSVCDPNQAVLDKDGVVLKEIERGDSFCIVADITVGGQDLGQILVEQGYARNVVKLAGAAVQQEQSGDLSVQPANGGQAGGPSDKQAGATVQAGYVSSKNSKVFHKPTCTHARRLQPDSMVVFSSRQEAIDSGRRPCKTCNP